MYVIKIVNNLFYLYYILILVRIFLTWIPSIDWHQQPIKTVREVTDIYLNIFRQIVPPYSGIDFSPIIALIALQIIQVVVTNVLALILS